MRNDDIVVERRAESKQQAIIERAKAVLLGNYRQQPIVAMKGQGAQVWDADGNEYLDMLGGIATCSLGHCQPQILAAVKAQAEQLWHVSNVFYSLPSIELAERLTKASGLERAFFCNSGGEANEAVIKLVRKAQKDLGHIDRYEIITFENSFHGRTLTTVSATGQPKYQKGFEPLTPGFLHVPYGDLEAVKKAIGARTAAIMVEPIQGEGGVRAAPEGFLRGLRELCDANGLFLVIDEVQTGMGRTGKMFGFQHDGVRPDAISLAKALGNGMPIGAMLCREELGKALGPGTHGSTFGGNLVAAAAANKVMEILSDPKTLADVNARGESFLQKARALQQRHPEKIVAVRGRGLLIGIEVGPNAGQVVARCREGGMLVNQAGERTVRFAPPFVISESQIDDALRIFESALGT